MTTKIRPPALAAVIDRLPGPLAEMPDLQARAVIENGDRRIVLTFSDPHSEEEFTLYGNRMVRGEVWLSDYGPALGDDLRIRVWALRNRASNRYERVAWTDRAVYELTEALVELRDPATFHDLWVQLHQHQAVNGAARAAENAGEHRNIARYWDEVRRISTMYAAGDLAVVEVPSNARRGVQALVPHNTHPTTVTVYAELLHLRAPQQQVVGYLTADGTIVPPIDTWRRP